MASIAVNRANLDCAAAMNPVTFEWKLYTNKYQCLISFF